MGSPLINFYLHGEPDSEGRTLEQIWDAPDYYFEASHSYIQWLFPLIEPSNFNPEAPLLSEEDISLFQNVSELKTFLYMSYLRYLSFLGLRYEEYEEKKFVPLDHFDERVLTLPNHNWLRITRMLKSMCILGLGEDARKFQKFLEENNYGSPNSQRFWLDAVS